MVESVAVIMLMGTLIIGIISAYWHKSEKTIGKYGLGRASCCWDHNF